MITFRVEGLKALEDKLKQIEPKVAKKIVRKAHSRATRLYVKTARWHLKNVSGVRGTMDLRNLRASIKASAVKGGRRRGGPFTVAKQIGPHTDSSLPYGPKDVFYAHWFERGVQPHSTGAGQSVRNYPSRQREGTQHPGIPAIRYMWKTAQTVRVPALDILKNDVAKGLADITKGGR